MDKTIIFTGGGTAGHVFPGLAVAEALQKEWPGRIVWVGSKKGMEGRHVTAAGIEYFGVPAGKMRRYLSIRNIIDIFKIAAGFIKCLGICRKLKPVMVFSKGGYVSVPMVFAAGRKGIPVVTHESDSDPGLATKLNSRYAVKICIAFSSTADYFDTETRKKSVLTGNPVRSMMLNGSARRGREWLGAPDGRKIILIVGGSQGAKQINDLVRAIADTLKTRYFLVHQMGPLTYEEISEPFYKTFDFIGAEMPDVLAAADIVVGRAGANTLAEISLLGKPLVLIPLMGGAGRGDQVKNAELYEREGAAVCLFGEEAVPENLLNAVEEIMENEAKRNNLIEGVKKLAHHGAAGKVAAEILQAAEKT